MLSFFRKLSRKLFSTEHRNRAISSMDEQRLSADLTANMDVISNILGSSKDVIIRKLTIGSAKKTAAALIFIDGLTDKDTISRDILNNIMIEIKKTNGDKSFTQAKLFQFIEENLVTTGNVQRTRILNDVITAVLSGDTALLVEGSNDALLLSTKGWEARGISEPVTEVVVRGPREGFTENIRTNTALLRRKLRNHQFTFDTIQVGKITKTEVCIAYLRGVVNERLIAEIKQRLNKIETDAVLESGYIEQYIEDDPFSLFATIGNSERPDTVAAKILEGRAAILVDGTPIVLTVPLLFAESFQSPEDYYSRPFYSSVIRWIRFIAFTISILLPASYVAMTTFNHEVIPMPLFLTMAAAREGTPFPSVVEAIGMGLVFEILREAGVRLPRPVGQAVSIVGALVIGESAVSAGIIGAPMVIVVALTAICSFVVPAQLDSGAIMRVILTIFAGIMGAFGIGIGLLIFLVHLVALRSFGAPYLSPISPLSFQDLKDVIIRAPLWAMLTRPRVISWYKPKRQGSSLKPGPPGDEKEEMLPENGAE